MKPIRRITTPKTARHGKTTGCQPLQPMHARNHPVWPGHLKILHVAI
jgi:hypothetical protein